MALQLFGVFAVLTARDNKTGPEKHRERAQKSMSQHTNTPAGDKLETLTINSARNASPETRQERNRNRNETKFFKKISKIDAFFFEPGTGSLSPGLSSAYV